MMDGQTSAPVSGGSNGSTGATTPAPTPSTREVVSVVPSHSVPSTSRDIPRSPNGQFAGNGGATGQSQTSEPQTGTQDQAGLGHAAKPTTDATAPEEWRFKDKLKINGQEQEVDLDRDTVRRKIQLAEAAFAQMREAKTELAKLEEFKQLARTNPGEALKQHGIDPAKWAAHFMAEQARESMIPEEQRQAMAQQAAFERERQEFQKQKQEFEAQQAKAYEEQVWKGIEPQFISAMEELNLPKGYQVMHAVAEVGREFLDAKLDLAPKEIVAEANRRLGDYTNRYVVTLPAKQLANLLGQEKVRELIALEVEKFKASQNFGSPAPVQSQPSQAADEPKQYIDEYEFRRLMRNK